MFYLSLANDLANFLTPYISPAPTYPIMRPLQTFMIQSRIIPSTLRGSCKTASIYKNENQNRLYPEIKCITASIQILLLISCYFGFSYRTV